MTQNRFRLSITGYGDYTLVDVPSGKVLDDNLKWWDASKIINIARECRMSEALVREHLAVADSAWRDSKVK